MIDIMEKSTFEQIRELIEEYNQKLEPYGIYCKANRHNINSPVLPLTVPRDIFGVIYNTVMKKREKKYFRNKPNNYKVIGIRISPIENNIIPKKDCKQYAFITESIERYEEGCAPKHKIRKTEKTLKKITKRLDAILKKAELNNSVSWCRNGLSDALRYGFNVKYSYIDTKILGISVSGWELIIAFLIILIMLLIFFVFINPRL